MKTRKLFYYAAIISLAAVIILPLICGISYTDVLSFIGMGGSGSTLAMAAVAGEVSTGVVTTDVITEKSSSLLMTSIRDNITKMKPASTPVDTILREMGLNIPIKSWESKFYSIDHRGFLDACASAVSSADGDEDEGTTFDCKVSNIHIWNVDDTVLFQGVYNEDEQELVCHVTGVTTSGSILTLVTVNGDGANLADWPSIPIETVMIRMGNAKKEEDAQTGKYATFPQPETNYCQRFMAQVEETLFAQDALKEVKWDIEDYRLQAIYDFKLSQELTILFGAKGRTLVGTDYIHHMNGITKLITTNTTYTDGSMSNDDIYKWAKAVFSGNSGSQKRYVFGGGDFIADLSALEPVQKQSSASNTEVVYGITFNRIVTNFGQFYVMHHDLLNSIGWGKKAIVLDMANIEKHTWFPLETKKIDLKGSGQRNVNAYVLDETYTVATRYPATHKIIEPA
jgi:hypothetical protein